MTDEQESYCRSLGFRFRIPGMDREDIEQEARIAMLGSPYPQRAARLRVIDLLKMALRKPQFAELHDRHGRDIEDRLDAREYLRATLAMPPMQRQTLLSVACGFTYEEVAEARGVTTSAVDGALYQARRKLRALEHAGQHHP